MFSPRTLLLAGAALSMTACSGDDTEQTESSSTQGMTSTTGSSSTGSSEASTGSGEATSGSTGAPTGTDTDALEPIVLPDGTEMLFEQGVDIPMRDGVNLSANIFRPAAPGQYPVIVAMTPYVKDWLPVEYDPFDGEIEISEYAGFEQPDPAYWVPRDYVVVSVDCRGMGTSEGDMALLTDLEAEDYYDTIEWLGVRPWSSGNVGLNGVSYMALNQWKVAQLHPPHLKAIMPWEGFTDVYRDFAYHGGIGGSAFFDGWWEFRILESKNPDSAVQSLYDDVANNPFDGDFYDSVSPTDLGSIDVPAYIVASWPDHGLHTRGTMRGYEQIGSEDKWMEIHGRKKWEWYYSDAAVARQEQFFDHFLHGEDNGMQDVPSVTYEVRSAYYEGETKTSSDWPPAGSTQTLDLDASDGTMSAQPADVAATADYSVVDGESGTVRFSHTFAQDTEISGSMNLRLWISVQNATDTDLFVGIQKFDADGTVVTLHGNDVEEGQVANGWLRASHRALDPERSSATRPYHLHTSADELTPGEIVEVQVEIHPSSTSFEAGQRIDVVIGGADQEESGLLHFGAHADGDVTVHTGADHPSQLVFHAVD